jgi:hypothetical protein
MLVGFERDVEVEMHMHNFERAARIASLCESWYC